LGSKNLEFVTSLEAWIPNSAALHLSSVIPPRIPNPKFFNSQFVPAGFCSCSAVRP
jgi:hypothetical protein